MLAKALECFGQSVSTICCIGLRVTDGAYGAVGSLSIPDVEKTKV